MIIKYGFHLSKTSKASKTSKGEEGFRRFHSFDRFIGPLLLSVSSIFMKTFKITTFFMSLFFIFACDGENKDADYLNGEIVFINKDSIKVRDVTSKTIHLKNSGYGMFSVYDSCMIFWSNKYPGHFYSIYNIDTEEELGYFCNKGRGHHEFSSIGPIFQFFKTGNELKTTICDFNKQKIFFWNISQSVLNRTTIYDTVIPYGDLSLAKNSIVDNLFYLPDDTFLAKIESLYLVEGDTPLPYYKQWGMPDKAINDYHVYKRIEMNDIHSDCPLKDRVYSLDAVKPDGSKIVQAMRLVPQINIIDTKTGKITFYRVSKVSRASLFDSQWDDGRVYYNSVQADDNYIYATYWGEKQWDASLGTKCPFIHIIHVFNWSGELLYEMKTDRVFFRIALDPIRNRLYTSNLDTDEMYYIDLSKL